VFLAKDMIRDVALKLVCPWFAPEEAVKAMYQEARHLASLHSPHVVTVFGYDEMLIPVVPGKELVPLHWMALEYMNHGHALDVWDSGVLSMTEWADAMIQASIGLSDIHDMGMIHRDIKPHNILFHKDGSMVCKLADLGIAVSRNVAHADFSGTFHYAAPEILIAKDRRTPFPFSTASDVYGLGAAFYRLFTGKTPLAAMAESLAGRGRMTYGAIAHATGAVPPARRLNPHISQPMSDVLALLLHHDPGQRPSVKEIHDLMIDVMDKPPLSGFNRS
jgi:serine/threonine-protein kinase